MFNVTKIRATNVAGKSFYANHLSANDYYSEKEKVVGIWKGKLADRFNLDGKEVTAEVFSLFQRNIDPFLERWYADGILDTLIETDQDTVFHFPTECSEIF